MSLWTMKDVTRMTGVTENALRYYNARGVLPPTIQEETGRRQWLYDEAAVEKLKELFLLKFIGVSIEDAGAAIADRDMYWKTIMKRLEELKQEREKPDLQIFIAQTLAVSGGADLFDSYMGMDEKSQSVLNEIIRNCIRESAQKQMETMEPQSSGREE